MVEPSNALDVSALAFLTTIEVLILGLEHHTQCDIDVLVDHMGLVGASRRKESTLRSKRWWKVCKAENNLQVPNSWWHLGLLVPYLATSKVFHDR
jgi:hypothetical protein